MVGWMRPLSLIVLAWVTVSIIGTVLGGIASLSPVLSLIILGASALLIMQLTGVRRARPRRGCAPPGRG
jgi:hypothetical protein